MQRIAIIDPSSRSLPYDFYYIREISKSYLVDFYCSTTQFNEDYIDRIKKINNVKVVKANISNAPVIIAGVNYFILLSKILFKKYTHIHFQWYIFFVLEFLFFFLYQKKLIITFHNLKPHSTKNNFYFPNFVLKTIASKVVFISTHVQNEFIKTYGKPKNFWLINHGIFPIKAQIPNDRTINKQLIFWGNIKPYKGVDVFITLMKSSYFNDCIFKIYGKWDNSLLCLKNELSERCFIINKYLSEKELSLVLQTEGIFIIPYENASQSGILYSLLGANRVFISTDKGDNGVFLKKYGLENLIFNKHDVLSIVKAMKYALSNYFEISRKLKSIKRDYYWENISYEGLYD